MSCVGEHTEIFFGRGGSWQRAARNLPDKGRETMLSAATYGLFLTISIVAIVIFILALEKLWSNKEKS